jgi:LysM repeat protein
MSKRPRPLFLLTLIAALIVTACTRFIGALPSAAGPPGGTPTVEVAAQAPTLPRTTAAPAQDGRQATVSELVNIVEAKPSAGAAYAPAQEGVVVGEGGQVRTGVNSRARVDLSEGTIIRLGPDTVFTIEAITEGDGGAVGLVSLDLGKLWASLTSGSLQVITPVGVASVRGSYALFQYDPGAAGDPNDNRLTIDCIEGACAAQLPGGDQQAGTLERIVVTGGQEVTRFNLTGEDVQAFIAENPDMGEALSATLTAAAPTRAEAEPTLTPTATPQPQSAPPGNVLGTHTVLGGETLFCIGRAYGVLPGAIAAANNLNPNSLLSPGQALIIPGQQWLNIPAGPVCRAQFDSPFPAGPAGPVFIPQITVLIPVEAPPSTAPGDTSTPTGAGVQPSPTPQGPGSNAPAATPNCPTPEFFDPVMDRCRIVGNERPDDRSPPAIAGLSGVAGASCTLIVSADVSDGESGVAGVSVTLTGAASPGPYAMSPVSGSTYQAVIAISTADYVTAATVQAADGAGNGASAVKSGGVVAACSGAL